MRVLVVAHYALPHVGGVEVLVDREIRALLDAGHEVVLLTSDGVGSAQTPVYPPSVRVLRVPAWHVLRDRLRLPYPLFGPSLLPTVWREVGRCDVVHVHGFMFVNTALAVAAAWLRKRPSVLTDHGGIQHFRSRLISWAARVGVETVGRLSSRLATRLVAYNTRILRLLERLSGSREKSLFLINPIDRELFRPAESAERRSLRAELGWREGRPIILFAGRLIPEKGIFLLLSAAAPDFDLVFCGPADAETAAKIAAGGATYLPARPQAELIRLYQAADVLAVPSEVREGFPVVVQEALACGLPVVLTEDPGFEPYRGMKGLHFTPRTVEGLRQSLRRVLSLPRTTPDDGALCPSPQQWVKLLLAGLVAHGPVDAV